jgi:hypothetical protein
MASRRGLEVYDLVFRFVKTLIRGVSQSQFDAWFSTPTIFGGFGAGQDGRVRLKIIKQSQDKTISTSLSFTMWDQRRAVVTGALRRAAGILPTPGITRTYSFERFRGVADMPPTEARDLASGKNIRTDWVLQDIVRFKDAYYRKLFLEWKLNTNVKIVQSDLPVHSLILEKQNIDSVYRKYRHLISETFTLENWRNSEVYYSRVKDFGNQVWAGICLRVASEGWGFWQTGPKSTWDLGHYRRALASLLLTYCAQYERFCTYRHLV